MHSSEDFEHLLHRENVVGVYWDAEAEVVRVIVSEKLPESELSSSDIISNAVADDVETDVLDAGLGRDKDGFEAQSDADPEPELEPTTPQPPKARYRPIKAGVSEIHEESTAATAGHYPALVVDADNGHWSADVAKGDLVRISNNHVYAQRNAASFGDYIRQPSPYDGGKKTDASGTLAGFVPLEDGGNVDVAARTSDPGMDAIGGFNLPDGWPTRVIRDPNEYTALVGQPVHKSGRTTGVTTSSVLATDAAVRVRFGTLGTLTMRGQIVAGDMSQGGDSGSPVYTEDGALAGHLFAGSDRFTIVNRADTIEAQFGVRLLTDAPQRPGSDGGWLHPDFIRRVWAYLRSVVGERLRKNVYLSGIQRRVDAVVDPDPKAAGSEGPWVIEAATTTAMMMKKLGYVLTYASQFHNARPVLVIPEKAEIDPEERDAVSHYATVLTELEAVDYFLEELSS